MVTATATRTSTMTEARVRDVTRKVEANLTALVVAGHLSDAARRSWIDDLIYLQTKEVVEFFEIQCKTPQGDRFGLRYVVSSDGSVRENASSGGVDVYGLPQGTVVSLYAKYNPGMPPAYVREELKRRGWGPSAGALDGDATEQRTFSSSGYGLTRSRVGSWP